MKCQDCKESVDEIVEVEVNGRLRNLCEECAEVREEQGELAEAAESAMQGMMEYKGR